MGFKPKVYKTEDLQKGPSGRLQFPAMSQGESLEVAGHFYGMCIHPEEGGSVTVALFGGPKPDHEKRRGISLPNVLELPYEGLIDELAGYLSAAGAAALEGRPALDQLTIRKGFDSHWIVEPRRPKG